MMTDSNTTVRELNPGIFQIRDLNGSSHSYVIKGHHERKDRLRLRSNFPVLERVFFTSA